MWSRRIRGSFAASSGITSNKDGVVTRIKAWPDEVTPRFRFATILEWPDLEAFERAFYAPTLQAELLENIKRLGEYEYSICQILSSSDPVEDTLS